MRAYRAKVKLSNRCSGKIYRRISTSICFCEHIFRYGDFDMKDGVILTKVRVPNISEMPSCTIFSTQPFARCRSKSLMLKTWYMNPMSKLNNRKEGISTYDRTD